MRRASVTQAAGRLQGPRNISDCRGQIAMCDVQGLGASACACECYRAVQQELWRLGACVPQASPD